MFKVPEKNRITQGQLKSTKADGNNGAFAFLKDHTYFFIIASDGEGWEHVSVHCRKFGKDQTPTWDEMCFIKSLFWDDLDVVIQYHPSSKDYINNHKNTLHLWRPDFTELPKPPKYLVGI